MKVFERGNKYKDLLVENLIGNKIIYIPMNIGNIEIFLDQVLSLCLHMSVPVLIAGAENGVKES